jgi:DNA-binding NarL/FixJ family response regulator
MVAMMTMPSMEREQLSVVLVDDHPFFREALKVRLQAAPRLRVVGEAATSDEARRQIEATRPSLVVIDLQLSRLADMSGLALTRDVHKHYRDTRVLICSGHGEDRCVAEAKRAGARGYVLKTCSPDEIVKAVELVAAGATYYSTGLDPQMPFQDPLTPRELETLKLVALGYSSKEIARELKPLTNVRTVESHRHNVMEKLGAKNTVEMIIFAYRLGLVDFMA